MPHPIKPKLSNDELVEVLLRQQPSLTLDKLIEIFTTFGRVSSTSRPNCGASTRASPQ